MHNCFMIELISSESARTSFIFAFKDVRFLFLVTSLVMHAWGRPAAMQQRRPEKFGS